MRKLFVLFSLLIPALASASGIAESVIGFDHANHKAFFWQPAVTGFISMGVIILLAVLGLSKLKKVPGGLQNAWEFAYEWLEEITTQVIGPKGPTLMWYFFSVFIYILIANLLGLIPYMASPTAKTDTTLALALCTFAVTHVLGMRSRWVAAGSPSPSYGWKSIKARLSYWGHFFHIVDASKETSFVSKVITALLQYILLPIIELVGELARPLSLTMRLFGNIFAKEMLLAILAFLVFDYYSKGTAKDYALMTMPLLLRPAVLILGVLVSLIQAVVFTALSMIYIGGAIATHDEHDEHGHGEAAHGAAEAHA